MKKVKVLKVVPNKPCEVIEIENRLENLQNEVGGLIQFVYPWEEMVGIICNDEGKINGLKPNRPLLSPNGIIMDVIYGTFLVVGLTDDSICSLTDSQLLRYGALMDFVHAL